jgi:phage-related protein
VQKLTALLCDLNKFSSLCVITCLEYFDDAKHEHVKKDSEDEDEEAVDRSSKCRFGFVFLKLEGESVITLHHLLKKASKSSLSRRIALAQAIINCLLSLHSIN